MIECEHRFIQPVATSMKVLDSRGKQMRIGGIPALKCNRCGEHKIDIDDTYIAQQKTMAKKLKLSTKEMSYLLSLGALDSEPIQSRFKFHKLLFLTWKETDLNSIFEYENDFLPAGEGPVAKKLKPTTAKLQKNGWISITGEDEQGFNYTLTDEGEDISHYLFENLPDKISSEFCRIKKTYLHMSREELKQYVHRTYPGFWFQGDTRKIYY